MTEDEIDAQFDGGYDVKNAPVVNVLDEPMTIHDAVNTTKGHVRVEVRNRQDRHKDRVQLRRRQERAAS